MIDIDKIAAEIPYRVRRSMDSAVSRFWGRVQKGNGCWEWKGACSDGYGVYRIGGARILLHRFSWELHYGPIPLTLSVCHKCDNRKCVRPDHLFLGTTKDNIHDCIRKGRHTINRTHCKWGHPLSGENLRLCDSRRGLRRVCLACERHREKHRKPRDWHAQWLQIKAKRTMLNG